MLSGSWIELYSINTLERDFMLFGNPLQLLALLDDVDPLDLCWDSELISSGVLISSFALFVLIKHPEGR